MEVSNYLDCVAHIDENGETFYGDRSYYYNPVTKQTILSRNKKVVYSMGLSTSKEKPSEGKSVSKNQDIGIGTGEKAVRSEVAHLTEVGERHKNVSKILNDIDKQYIESLKKEFTETLKVDEKRLEGLKLTEWIGSENNLASYDPESKSILMYTRYMESYEKVLSDPENNREVDTSLRSVLMHEMTHHITVETGSKLEGQNAHVYAEGIAEFVSNAMVEPESLIEEKVRSDAKNFKLMPDHYPYILGTLAALTAKRMDDGKRNALVSELLNSDDPEEVVKMLHSLAEKSGVLEEGTELARVVKSYDSIKNKLVAVSDKLTKHDEIEIAYDNDWFVRATLARNNFISDKTKRVLAADNVDSVVLALIEANRRRLESKVQVEIARRAPEIAVNKLAEMPDLSDRAQIEILKRGGHAVTTLAKNFFISERAQKAIANMPDSSDPRALENKACLTVNLFERFGPISLSFEGLTDVINVLKNGRSVSKNALDALSSDENDGIRMLFAINAKLGINPESKHSEMIKDYQVALAKDKSEIVRVALASLQGEKEVFSELSLEAYNILKGDKSKMVMQMLGSSNFERLQSMDPEIYKSIEDNNPEKWSKEERVKYSRYLDIIRHIEEIKA